MFGTTRTNTKIHQAVVSGAVQFEGIIVTEGQRLDIIAGKVYGDSSYWWVIAAASGIGWGLQVPAGTFIRVPKDLDDIFGLVS